MNQLIEKVHCQSKSWAEECVQTRIHLLDGIRENLKSCSETYFHLCLGKRGLTYRDACSQMTENERVKLLGKSQSKIADKLSYVEASNYLHGPLLLAMHLSMIRDNLVNSKNYGPIFSKLKVKPIGEHHNLVELQPKNLFMTALLTFGTLELLVEGKPELNSEIDNQDGGVAVILGAGNYDAPIDILHAIFTKKQCCIYKLHDLNKNFSPVLRNIFEPLINFGILEIVSGDISLGEKLVIHPLTKSLYLTGSVKSANSILWGTPEPDFNKEGLKPRTDAKLCFELGNCTPIVICPGAWSDRELRCQASHLAFFLLFNGGHFCVHPQLIVTCKNWPLRKRFLQLIKKYQNDAKYVNCFYPGTEQKMEVFKNKLKQDGLLEENFCIGSAPQNNAINSNCQDIVFVENLSQDSFLTKEETFCPVAGEIPLDTEPNIAEFLPNAVKFLNQCHGTLSCSILVKEKSNAAKEVINQAILDLNYCSININSSPMLGICFPVLRWGGSDAETTQTMQSGVGCLGNCYGFVNAKKSISRFPFINLLTYLLCIPSNFVERRLPAIWRECLRSFINLHKEEKCWVYFHDMLRLVSAFLFG